MFIGRENMSMIGGLAIGVPGELRAYQLAHQKLGGKLPWADLFAPTIKLCREGFILSSSQAAAIEQNRPYIFKDPTLKFVDRCELFDRNSSSFPFLVVERCL